MTKLGHTPHSGRTMQVENFYFVAHLTNTNAGLDCPTLRAPDEGKPASVLWDYGADWSAMRDAFSKEDALQLAG